jgi:hypothetical protein
VESRTFCLALLVLFLVVATLGGMGAAEMVQIRLNPADLGSHASEGTRVPSEGAQYNRTEVFVGFSTRPELLSFRSIFGFNLSQIPSGARIDDASLSFKTWSGNADGIEVYLSPEPVVESGFDWDTPNGTQPWSVPWVRGSATGLGPILSSSVTTYNAPATITMTDTTGHFAPAAQSAFHDGTPLTVIVTSLATEAAGSTMVFPAERLLRIWSDDTTVVSDRPVLNVTYTPIRPIGQSQFLNPRTLDFEGFANGFLDATAVNPTTNPALVAAGITSITGAGGSSAAGGDYQNQSSPNGKGLFFNGQRFIILPRDSDPFDNAAYPFGNDQVFTIDFADRYDQFGLSFHDQVAQNFTMSFYLDGDLQGQYVQAVPLTGATGSNGLFGLQTPFLFNRVSIDGSAVDGYGIDNITVGLTPEPSSVVLAVLGVAGLAAGACRRGRRPSPSQA